MVFFPQFCCPPSRLQASACCGCARFSRERLHPSLCGKPSSYRVRNSTECGRKTGDRGRLWEYHSRCEQGPRACMGWALVLLLKRLPVCPPDICQHSQLVPHQEVLKMAPKFHPRNTRKCLFSLESEECHKAELFKVAFFASKYILLFKLVFSFILRRYQSSKGVLTLGPYLRFSEIPRCLQCTVISLRWLQYIGIFSFPVPVTVIPTAQGQNPVVSKSY